jgi:hypothetical protein
LNDSSLSLFSSLSSFPITQASLFSLLCIFLM